VVRPNFDTLYSTLWFDLRGEPLIISTPDTTGRYYILPMLDMWTDVFAVVGSRTTGAVAGDYALVDQQWTGVLPTGVERITSPTPFGWIIGRTQTNGPTDYQAVNAIQDGFVATPLSRWGAEALPDNSLPGPPQGGGSVAHEPPLNQVLNMTGEDFMACGVELMQLHPPHIQDQPVVARMRRLGVRKGEVFRPEGAGPEVLAAIQDAPALAQTRMSAVEPHLNPTVDGWALPTSAIGVYGTDYLRRSVVAKIGLGANLPEDAVYPVLYADNNGEIPNGDHNYELHFGADALPPVDAFWSVTMYDGEGFPVPNAMDRYAIGDRDALWFNPDGSLDIFIQHESPGQGRRANWLPSPRGPLGLTLRLYGPRLEVLDRSWAPPPLERCSG
jgi:hypothetical protein